MFGACVFGFCPIWASTTCPPISECGCTFWHDPWSHTPSPSPHANSHMLLLAPSTRGTTVCKSLVPRAQSYLPIRTLWHLARTPLSCVPTLSNIPSTFHVHSELATPCLHACLLHLAKSPPCLPLCTAANVFFCSPMTFTILTCGGVSTWAFFDVAFFSQAHTQHVIGHG